MGKGEREKGKREERVLVRERVRQYEKGGRKNRENKVVRECA